MTKREQVKTVLDMGGGCDARPAIECFGCPLFNGEYNCESGEGFDYKERRINQAKRWLWDHDKHGNLKANSLEEAIQDHCRRFDDYQEKVKNNKPKEKKIAYHRLPPDQLQGMAEIMNKGAETHEVGYMELDPLLYYNATWRHLMAIRRGELVDEEGNSHMLAIACNGMILDRMLGITELKFDD